VTFPENMPDIEANAFCDCSNLKYAPLILSDGKMLYEPPNRNDVSFSWIRQLVHNHDYSIEMNHDVKYNLIFQMFAFGLDQKETFAYISENFSAMFPVLIDMDDIKLIHKILASEKFITKENIDDLIRYAIDTQKHEIQLILTDYKNRKSWYQNIDDISDKFKL